MRVSRSRANGTGKALPPPAPPSHEHIMPLEDFAARFIRPALAGIQPAIDRMAIEITEIMKSDRAALVAALEKDRMELMSALNMVVIKAEAARAADARRTKKRKK